MKNPKAIDYDFPSSANKTSCSRWLKATKLGKKMSTGAMPKRQAQGVMLAAIAFHEKPLLINGSLVNRRGFETVLDSGIDKPKCSFCGKGNCKVVRLDLPIDTLTRFAEENFTCDEILNCIKDNRDNYVNSDKFLYGNLPSIAIELDFEQLTELLNLSKSDKSIRLGKRHLDYLEKETANRLAYNENLLKGVRVITSREKLDVSYAKPKGFSKRVNHKEIKSKLIYETVSCELTVKERLDVKLLVAQYKRQLETIGYARCAIAFTIPSLVTKAKANELTELANKTKNANKRKAIMFRVRQTETFIDCF